MGTYLCEPQIMGTYLCEPHGLNIKTTYGTVKKGQIQIHHYVPANMR